MAIKICICLAIGYLFGCFSTGYIVGKRSKVDIRKYGSGNAGTTNAFRTLGKKAGIITFLGDFIKAVIPILLVRFLIFPDQEYTKLLETIIGFGVVMGHNYPFWLRFKGGKGIAVTAGVFASFDFRIIPVGIILFATVVLVTKYVSVGSLLIALLLPVWIAITQQDNTYYIPMIGVALCFTCSAIYKHRANIKRLMNGTENKIGQHVKISENKDESN